MNQQAAHRDTQRKAEERQAKQTAEILELNDEIKHISSENKGLQSKVDALQDAKGLAETSGEEKDQMIANLRAGKLPQFLE